MDENGSQYLLEENFDNFLRLGDIIEGFSYFIPEFEDFVNKKHDFKIEVKTIQYFVVLTPCCSIEDKVLTLVPLKRLEGNLLKNPYYEEDFTRINQPFNPKFSIPPDIWDNKFTEERKNEILQQEPTYQYMEKFVFGEHEKLEDYTLSFKSVKSIKTKCYWIDFKDAFTFSCNKIQRGNSYSKILQLKIGKRHELREKLAWFYSRVPEEDKVIT